MQFAQSNTDGKHNGSTDNNFYNGFCQGRFHEAVTDKSNPVYYTGLKAYCEDIKNVLKFLVAHFTIRKLGFAGKLSQGKGDI